MLNLGKVTEIFYHHICIALYLSPFTFIRCPFAVQLNLIRILSFKGIEYTNRAFIWIIKRSFHVQVHTRQPFLLFSEAF